MKQFLLVVGAAIFAAASANPAWAQIPRYSAGPETGGGGPTLKRSTRPVVSAYAGLLGSGVGANSGVGYQYFTRVQPQVATQRALGSLGRSVNRLQAQSQTGLGSLPLSAQQQLLLQQQGTGLGLGTTGHATGYFSHTRYFGTNLQGGTPASGGGGGGPGMAAAGLSGAGASAYFGGGGGRR
jgi:hypothetical protein